MEKYKRYFNESKIDSADVYDYFMDITSKGKSPKKAAQLTINHFERMNDDFDIYSLVDALGDEYELDELMEEVLEEEGCPDGTKPRNGGCANADGNSYRKGSCDVSYRWDGSAGGAGKCVHKTDDRKHQK